MSNVGGRSDIPIAQKHWAQYTENPYFISRWQEWLPKWKHWRSQDAELTELPRARRRIRHRHFQMAMAFLSAIGCDTDVVLRLAFIEFCHHPLPRHPLSGKPKQQQHLRRRVQQAEAHLTKAALLLREADNIQNLLHIGTNRIADLDYLAGKCRDEERVLMDWGPEFPEAHDLFLLATYISSFGNGRRRYYEQITDVLTDVYAADEQTPPTLEEISKAIQRFDKLKNHVSQDLRGYPKQVVDMVRRGRETMRIEFLAAFPE
jgi:hypothetical protein